MGRGVHVWLVSWVRVVVAVTVPVPEPEWTWLECAVAEGRFRAGAVIRVEKKPQQLLIVGVRC